MSEPLSRPAITPLLWYRQPTAALAWLEHAFGFETQFVVSGEGEAASGLKITGWL